MRMDEILSFHFDRSWEEFHGATHAWVFVLTEESDWQRLTWVPVELILPDKFEGELYEMTTTHYPPTESHGRAISSHSQTPVAASVLNREIKILEKNVYFIDLLLLCNNPNYVPSIWQAWMVSKWVISSSSLAWILSSRFWIVYWKQNDLMSFILKMCRISENQINNGN